MRPQGRGPLDSLYFRYPSFGPPEPADRAALSRLTPVAIVGAGPVGMTAALTLAGHGIPSVLLDDKGTLNDGSRAICIARQSFHILESVGAVAPFLAKALPWTTGRTYYRGHLILEFAMPDSADEKFRPMYNLQQQYTELFLWQAIERCPLVEARWQSRVVGLRLADGGARLTVEDPGGSYELPAAWVLAADGARSPLRRMCGLRLKGDNYEGRYVIADLLMEQDYPTIRRALFDPAARPGGTVLIHRQPDNIWRIDYQLGDGEAPEAAIEEAEVRRVVGRILEEIGHDRPWELEWWSIYSANTLALDDYRHGPVFFIGDSAHIVPIFGVRGLNNGLADAQNIGWKLAWVLNGWADPRLLESYTPERRGATLDVFANASRSTRFMTPPSRGWRIMRDAALSLGIRHDVAGALANPRQMTPYTYADSPLTRADDAPWEGGPAPGAVAASVAEGPGFLTDAFGPGFTLLAFGAAGARAAEAVRAPGPPPTVVVRPADAAAASTYAAADGTVYLIRPDMHVAARWRTARAAEVGRALEALLAGGMA